MHTGDGTVGGDDYVGLDVHRAARIAATGHGGQVLLSATTAELARERLTDGIMLSDLGEHRLKDLARPERIFQLRIDGLPADFPPIRSLETPHNLPVQRTSFVGRDSEVEKVKGLLKGPGLLTLTGPGGSGKTRLALKAAGDLLDDYGDGVFLVELAPITDPLLIPASIADTLGIRSEGRRPVLDTLREQVRDRETLLVLDNFEQVVEGAQVVSSLLDAAPKLRVLVTSREPLHVAGEQELPVPPLELPSAEDLFVQRATAVDPAFRVTEENAAAVAELCRRLDGLPLAIELAASRVKLLSPKEILERLEHRLELLTGGAVDLPARQRTLREAIAWSHDLLDENERVLFRRLSVFAGGWTLESAEAVAHSPEEGGDILEILGSLVDKSLARRMPRESGEARFGMLETIREFGREELEAAGEAAAIHERHAAHFLGLAESAEPHLRRVDQKEWLDRLEVEHDNLRLALRWAIGSDTASVGLRLTGALWRFWQMHGHLDEGRRWAEEVVAVPSASERTAGRAKGVSALGSIAYWQEDFGVTRKAYEESLEIAREIGDRATEAEAVYNMAYPPAYEEDFDTAIATVKEARKLFEELGIERGVADTIWLLAIVARVEGDIEGARALAEESLRRHRAIGDRFGTTDALRVLGRIALSQGDLETAGASYLEALENDEVVGNQTGMGIVLDNLASKATAEGRHLDAVRLAGASEKIKEAAGGHAPPPFIDLTDPREAASADLGDAAVRAAWDEGYAMTLEQALEYARREI
jgi:predicted ATPase